MFLSDMNVPLLLSAMAFLVMCLLGIGIQIYIRGLRYRRSMIEKIGAADDEWATIGNDAQSSTLSGTGGSENLFVKFLSAIGVRTNPGRSTDDADIKLKFLRAGLRGKKAPTIFWGIKFLLAVCLPLVFIIAVVLFFQPMNSKALMTGAIFLSLLGLFLPDFWLRMKTSKRKDRIVKGFPDALDLLVVCVEAGIGLDAATHRVGEELGLTHPELSQEFQLLNLELRAGKARHAALKNLAERTDVEDVRSLVTVLFQTERFGTSIAQALRVFADSFRTARYQRAEEAAAKIATKLLFPLVLFIFPSMFGVILGPVAITIYRTMIHPS